MTRPYLKLNGMVIRAYLELGDVVWQYLELGDVVRHYLELGDTEGPSLNWAMWCKALTLG